MSLSVSEENTPVVLATGYYRDNFFKILDFVDHHYDDLRNDEERAFSRCFRALSHDAQCLYVRLLMRKGPFFRCDKPAYREIGDLPGAVTALVQAGLALHHPTAPIEGVLALLNRAEVETLLVDHAEQAEVTPKALRKKRKDALLECVVTHLPAATVTAWVQRQFNWISLLGEAVLLRYRLLFFGNSRQDWQEFVLLDLGLVRYEPVSLFRGDRLFQSRDLLDTTVAWLDRRAFCELAMAEEDEAALAEAAATMPPTLDEAVLRRRRDRLHNRVASWFERRGRFEEALTWYGVSARPPARERRARLLVKLNRPRAAMALCRELLDGPATEEERLFARTFRVKVAAKLGHKLPPAPRTKFPERELTLVRDSSRRIESQVLSACWEEGIQGFYAENGFWLSLFGLIFWDIVYAPVRGAFFNHYQRGPTDLFSSAFYENRRTLIEQRLAWLRAEVPWLPLAQQVYRYKQGIHNYLVGWDPHLPEQLDLVQARIPGADLALIFERFAGDPGCYRNGFPDLLLFPPAGGYRLTEVKGPGDQLQPNQRGWLKYFLANGLPLEVLRVTWCEGG